MLIWLVPASKDQEKNENIATCISIIRCKIIGEEKKKQQQNGSIPGWSGFVFRGLSIVKGTYMLTTCYK